MNKRLFWLMKRVPLIMFTALMCIAVIMPLALVSFEVCDYGSDAYELLRTIINGLFSVAFLLLFLGLGIALVIAWKGECDE